MKILHEVKNIDLYLRDKMDPASRLVFEAELLIIPSLAAKVACQSKLYKLIRQSGRRKIKKEVEQIQRKLFSDPTKADFSSEILKLFPNT
jgi:hypothetical protein